MTAWVPHIGASDSPTRWDPGFLATLLRSDRLTLVFSPAGADRDAMLRGALMPLLGRRSIDRSIVQTAPPAGVLPLTERRRQRRDSRRGAEVVIRFDGWGATPLHALREQLAAVLPPAPGDAPASTLAALLQATARRHDAQLLLVFDSYEQHLATSPSDLPGVEQFDHQLLDWLRQPDSPARVLLLVDDASQELLLRRYGDSIRQFGRGWLRIRPQAQTKTGTATMPSPDVPVAQPRAADLEDEIRTFVRGLDLGAPGEPDLRVQDSGEFVALRPADHAAPEERPTRRFATLAGTAVGLLMGLGVGWWFLAPNDRVAGRIGATTIAPAPVGVAVAPSAPHAAAPAPAMVTQDVPVRPTVTPPDARPRPVEAAAPSLTLEVAVPPDSGNARTLMDELARKVAGPAGIVLTIAPPGNPAAAAILRADSLPAARETASSGGPRLLLPVFREQVQVVARAEGRWRFLHQLKGAHLNVGEAGGARARTANALYRRLYGGNLPSWDTDRRDEASALRELLREGSALDAVIVVSDRPALEQVPVPMRAQLRVLVLDPQHPSTAEVMRGFAVTPDQGGRGPVLQVTSYLVMPEAAGPAPALQALACALGRAQPELQQRGSTLLRGLDPRTSIPGGWVSLLAHSDAGCSPR